MPGRHPAGDREAQVLEALNEALYIIDAAGRLQFCNAALARLTGYAAGALLGRPSLDLYAVEDRPAVLDRRTRAFRGEPVPSLLEATLVRHDGARLPVELSLSSLTRGAQVVGRVVVGRDISARKHAVAALQASEERFRLLVEGVQDYAIYLLDPEGHVASWNVGAERIKGYTAADILGAHFSRFFPPEEQRQGTPARLLEQAAREGHYVGEGWRVRRDGSRFWASVVVTALRDRSGGLRGFAKVTRDMTDRKAAEEVLHQANAALERRVEERTAALAASEAQLHAIYTHAPVGISQTSLTGQLIRVNRRFCDITGYPEGDLLGRPFQAITHPDDLPRNLDLYHRLQAGEFPSYDMEKRYVRQDGQIVWAHLTGVLVRDAEGRPSYGVAVIQDITARKAAEAALRASEEHLKAALHEKEVLLKEIHHRVKNNLQVVASLLALQADRLKDPVDVALFEDTQHRVNSMALVHESLYSHGDLAHLDFASYIERLATHLVQASAAEGARLRVRTELEGLALDVDAAIPCGLILNELLTNALKYAFPDGRAGDITIGLQSGAGQVTLLVRDTGVGFPGDLDFRRTESLGLQLVGMLTEQLGGTLTLTRAPGTTFTLTFPYPRDR
jgi:PAS domain S-box-containing protein